MRAAGFLVRFPLLVRAVDEKLEALATDALCPVPTTVTLELLLPHDTAALIALSAIGKPPRLRETGIDQVFAFASVEGSVVLV